MPFGQRSAYHRHFSTISTKKCNAHGPRPHEQAPLISKHDLSPVRSNDIRKTSAKIEQDTLKRNRKQRGNNRGSRNKLENPSASVTGEKELARNRIDVKKAAESATGFRGRKIYAAFHFRRTISMLGARPRAVGRQRNQGKLIERDNAVEKGEKRWPTSISIKLKPGDQLSPVAAAIKPPRDPLNGRQCEANCSKNFHLLPNLVKAPLLSLETLTLRDDQREGEYIDTKNISINRKGE